MEFFARQLSAHTNRKVTVPKAGTIIENNTIYVSPASAHLVCGQRGSHKIVDHLDYYPDSRYSPSVDALFASVAEIYAQDALAIVLSGMGNDGAAGAKILAASNARVIVQDAESSVVWGMPGAVAKAGFANAILPPAHLIRYLSKVAVA
jgi:two-component system, chemotaxis family, protein-glutamate methylesterase/glutaminase